MNQLSFPASFLQSPEWEQLQKNIHRTTWRVEDVLIVRHKLGLGSLNYLYIGRPELPPTDVGVPEKIGLFLDEVARIADVEQSLFLRIDRVEPAKAVLPQDVLAKCGRIGHSLQPQQTSILDLSKSENELLGAMHEKTRYNIRLAEKKGVEIKKVLRQSAKEDFEIFWSLLTETARRDAFHTHTRAHYEMLAETKSAHFSNELFFAEHEGKAISAAMVNFYQPISGVPGVATYLHGASTDSARNVMAPYALHWYIAREAKARGYGRYDFWGIDEKKMPGVTRFKRGFGGYEIVYAPTVEIVYRLVLAGLYRAARWFR